MSTTHEMRQKAQEIRQKNRGQDKGKQDFDRFPSKQAMVSLTWSVFWRFYLWLTVFSFLLGGLYWTVEKSTGGRLTREKWWGHVDFLTQADSELYGWVVLFLMLVSFLVYWLVIMVVSLRGVFGKFFAYQRLVMRRPKGKT